MVKDQEMSGEQVIVCFKIFSYSECTRTWYCKAKWKTAAKSRC